jgi:hypothetical protein
MTNEEQNVTHARNLIQKSLDTGHVNLDHMHDLIHPDIMVKVTAAVPIPTSQVQPEGVEMFSPAKMPSLVRAS